MLPSTDHWIPVYSVREWFRNNLLSDQETVTAGLVAEHGSVLFQGAVARCAKSGCLARSFEAFVAKGN